MSTTGARSTGGARQIADGIAGKDSIAWALGWSNRKKSVLLETFTEFNMVLANVGTSYTFRESGLRSGPDICELHVRTIFIVTTRHRKEDQRRIVPQRELLQNFD